MNLRRKVIRLAYQRPDLRPHLLPLLRKQARWGTKTLLKKDGVWTVSMDQGGKPPLEAPLAAVVAQMGGDPPRGDYVDVYYLRDAPREVGRAVSDYGRYFFTVGDAISSLKGFTYREIMEIGRKRIPLESVAVDNKFKRRLALRPKKRNTEPGIDITKIPIQPFAY